jgi:hypothetical protein
MAAPLAAAALITVFFPYYCNPSDLAVSVESHRRRAAVVASLRLHIVQFQPGCPLPALLFGITVSELVIPKQVIGGGALPYFFEEVQKLAPPGIVVLCDTDAFMLRNGWDTDVRAILETHSVAGINPRSSSRVFANRTEWNWIAFWRDRFDLSRVLAEFHAWKLHDWGEWFTRVSPTAVHTWPPLVFMDGAQVICGTPDKGPWVLHKFYGSRTRNEAISAPRSSNTPRALHALALANLRA